MEPLLELADRITAHVWYFHQASPSEQDFEKLSTSSLSDRLRVAASADYTKLEAVLDLADLSHPDDADPDNPLPHFRLAKEQEEEKGRFWNPIQAMRIQGRIRRERKEKNQQIRELAAEEAFKILGIRSAALLAEGMQNKISLVTAPPKRLANEQSDIASEDSSGDHASQHLSDESAASSAAEPMYVPINLLTSDELFEEVARWLNSLELEQQCNLAIAFLPLKVAIPAGALLTENVEQGRKPPRSLPKSIEKLISVFNTHEVPPRFLIEMNINTRARLISADRARSPEVRKAAAAWLETPAQDRPRILLERSSLTKLCAELEVPVPFSMVMGDELHEIYRSRVMRLFEDPSQPGAGAGHGNRDAEMPPSKLPTQQAFDSCLFGVALSGGGIRSATFALGLLQGMADRNILPYIDVLSSVSGGGYIASWLIAWTKRRGGIKAVQDSLRGFASPIKCSDNISEVGSCARRRPFGFLSRNQDPHGDHLRPVRLLREYARYLAPQSGLFSADSWTILTTWARNTFLNLVILLLLFGSVLLLPRLVIFTLFHSQVLQSTDNPAQLGFFVFLAASPFLFCCATIGKNNLSKFGRNSQDLNAISRGFDDTGVVSKIVIPLLIGGLIELDAIWNLHAARHPFASSLAFLLVTAVGILILRHYSKDLTQGDWSAHPVLGASVIGGASLISFSLMYAFCGMIDKFGMNTLRGLWMAGAFGPAVLMVVVGTTILGFLGLSGTMLSEEQREWWSRLGAWLLLTTLTWVVICVICFFMPLWIAMAGIKIAAAGIAWGSLTAAGVKLAFSAKSTGKDGGANQSTVASLVLSLAPTVFVIGLLSLTSLLLFWGNNLFINLLLKVFNKPGGSLGWLHLVDDQTAHQLCCTNLPMTFERVVTYYWPLMNADSLAPLLLALLLFGLCYYFAWRVDINEFSMHHFYRNRLVRAYLGASRLRAHRLPNAFTGFDMEDDIRLQRFRLDDPTHVRDMVTDCNQSYVGPFPILNTALNITKGQDLGMQERRAEAFFFSPLWSGFDFSRKQTRVRKSCMLEFGFRKTAEFGTDRKGASLGTAMAISGAAFSSNAGFHTSPPLAFLLTVFGVRLGWWAGNPRANHWDADSPPVGLLYLLYELTANTSTDREFVLLTDGGHFENMGLYELVRRRCRFILVSDAEEDQSFKLEGIGGAVRKCRNDFGVVITLNIDALQPIGDPSRSALHYSIGTIRYPGEKECGTIVYIKASLTGDEAIDLMEFGKRHKEFPHTSTANQFFDESHFESYRELGHHVASGIFQHDMPATPLRPGTDVCAVVRGMFNNLEQGWAEALNKTKSQKKNAAASESGESGGGE
jgi:hypothetical protein